MAERGEEGEKSGWLGRWMCRKMYGRPIGKWVWGDMWVDGWRYLGTGREGCVGDWIGGYGKDE